MLGGGGGGGIVIHDSENKMIQALTQFQKWMNDLHCSNNIS